MLFVGHSNEHKQSVAHFALPHNTHTFLDWVMHISQHFGDAHGAVFEFCSRYRTGEVRIKWSRWVVFTRETDIQDIMVMNTGVVLFLMRHKTTSQILPFIAAGAAVELVLNLFGEDTKQSPGRCFGHAGYLLGICRPTWVFTFQTERHLILQFLHPLVPIH